MPSRKKKVKEKPQIDESADNLNDSVSSSIAETSKNVPWTPAHLYRSRTCLVISEIRKSGAKGMSRTDVAGLFCPANSLKSRAKHSGILLNEIVSKKPGLLSEKHVAEGRQTTTKYFLSEFVVDSNKEFREEFEKLSGLKTENLPNKIDCKEQGFMRVTDVTIRRFALTLRILDEYKVISLVHRFNQMIRNLEKQILGGKCPEMDRKTSMRILTAMDKYQLLKVYSGEITIDGKTEKVICICRRDITEDDPLVADALAAIHSNKGSPVKRAQTDPYLALVPPKKCRKVEGGGSGGGVTKTGLSTITRISALQGIRQRQQARDSGRFAEEKIETREQAKAGKKSYNSNIDDNDIALRYGYQSKQVRLEILHELVFYLTRGFKGTGPSLIELIPIQPEHDLLEPPTQNSEKPFEFLTPHVYLDVQSWKRFLPPLPVYADTYPGWFLVYDLMLVMPLSLFVMLIPAKKQMKELDEYLLDPIKRHTPICHLSQKLRYELFCVSLTRRVYQYCVSNLLHCLTILGVLSWGPLCAATRMLNLKFECFYVHTQVTFRDTSVSERGYMMVEQPMDMYKEIKYNLKEEDDVLLYWQHLRAVCLSTDLGYRSCRKPTALDQSSVRFSSLTTSLEKYRLTKFEAVPKLTEKPLEPYGCAGIDPRLFLCTARNWALNPCPMASWLDDAKRKVAEVMTEKAVSRTSRPKYGLIGIMMNYAMMAPEIVRIPEKKTHFFGDVHKMAAPPTLVLQNFAQLQKSALERCKIFRGSRAQRANNLRTNQPLPPPTVVKSTAKEKNNGNNMKISLRAKYTSQEMEMLYLVKALAFFLEPSMRLWFGGTTVATVCHKYVPKSRDKAGTSLLAVMNRTMQKRKEAREKVDQFVHKMNTMPDLLKLKRNTKITMKLKETERSKIFINAMELCHRLVYQENKELNSTNVNEDNLREFLEKHNVHNTTPEVCKSPGKKMPMQNNNEDGTEDEKQELISGMFSWKDFKEINHDTIRDAMFHYLVQASCGLNKSDRHFSVPFYDLFRCFSSEMTIRVLNRMRRTSLLSTTRSSDRLRCQTDNKLYMVHGEYMFSNLYRSFFTGALSGSIPEQSASAMNQLRESGVSDLLLTSSIGCPAFTASVLSQDHIAIIVTMPDDLFGMQEEAPGDNVEQDEQTNPATKVKLLQLRQQRLAQCEAADNRTLNLSLEKAAIVKPLVLEARFKNFTPLTEEEKDDYNESKDDLLSMLLTYLPNKVDETVEINPAMLPDNVTTSDDLMHTCHKIVHFVEKRGISGVNLNKIKELQTKFPKMECTEAVLGSLCAMGMIFVAGICEKVFVHIKYTEDWSLRSKYIDEHGKEHMVYYMPRPWLRPDGTLNLPMARWICEGMFLQLSSRPFKTEAEVLDSFDPVLTPVATLDLLEFLVAAQAVRVNEKTISQRNMEGPFGFTELKCTEKFVEPLPDGAINLGQLFLNINLPDFVSDSLVNSTHKEVSKRETRTRKSK